MAESVRLVLPTGQTGATVASPVISTPIVPTISSAGFSRTKELANINSSYTTVVCSVPPIPPQGSGGPIPNNVHNDLLKLTPVSSVQMMAQTDPITHRLSDPGQRDCLQT